MNNQDKLKKLAEMPKRCKEHYDLIKECSELKPSGHSQESTKALKAFTDNCKLWLTNA